MSFGRRAAFIAPCSTATSEESLEVKLTSTNFDAFGRLRTSEPFTLFEFNSILGENLYNIQQATTGTGTVTANTNESYVQMGVTGTGSVIRQSREYIMYQPGKSKLAYLTGVLYGTTNTAGITTRIGCYDDSTGIYIEMKDGVISVVEHDSVFNTIAQSDWYDRLDGTGPSGATVDFTKAQIFYFDFEWLGVGQVRCGIIQEGRYIPYYTFTHKNTLIAPYIQMAKLPLRYEIIGTAGAGTNWMRMICGTVISEGGVSPLGKMFMYDNFTLANVPQITKPGGGSPSPKYLLFALRLRKTSQYNRSTIKIKTVNVANANTTALFCWSLILNPTVSTAIPDASWANYNTHNTTVYAADSATQYFNGPNSGNPGYTLTTTCTGGQALASGFCAGRDSVITFSTIDELIATMPIGSNIDGTVPDVVALAVNIPASSSGSSANVSFALQWMEIM